MEPSAPHNVPFLIWAQGNPLQPSQRYFPDFDLFALTFEAQFLPSTEIHHYPGWELCLFCCWHLRVPLSSMQGPHGPLPALSPGAPWPESLLPAGKLLPQALLASALEINCTTRDAFRCSLALLGLFFRHADASWIMAKFCNTKHGWSGEFAGGRRGTH